MRCHNYKKCHHELKEEMYQKYNIVEDMELLHQKSTLLDINSYENPCTNNNFNFDLNGVKLCELCFFRKTYPGSRNKKYILFPKNGELFYILSAIKKTCSQCKKNQWISHFFKEVKYLSEFELPKTLDNESSEYKLFIERALKNEKLVNLHLLNHLGMTGNFMIISRKTNKNLLICGNCVVDEFKKLIPTPEYRLAVFGTFSGKVDLDEGILFLSYSIYKINVQCKNCGEFISFYNDGITGSFDKRFNNCEYDEEKGRYVKDGPCYKCPKE